MNIKKIILEEVKKLFSQSFYDEQDNYDEGVGDKYLQNKGIMPDPDSQYISQTSPAIKNSDMGELIGYIDFSINYFYSDKTPNDKQTPIYKNPRNLTNFDSGARAVSDDNGNLFVAQINGNYVHRNFSKPLNLDVYDKIRCVTWMRIGKTNKFAYSDSYMSIINNSEYEKNNHQKDIIETNLNAVRKNNPNFEFLNDKYTNFDKNGNIVY